jgi:outer membrane protein
MKNFKYGSALLGLLLTAGSFQSIAQPLTLTDAIQLSLKNSKQLKLSHAKVAEAVANSRDARNHHLPDLKVSGAYMRLNNPEITSGKKDDGSGNGQPSPFGTTTINQVAYGMATATFPVFSGLRIKYGVESAKYLEEATRLDAIHDKEGVIQNTINAYTNLYKAQKTVELVKENLRHEEQRVKDFTNLEKNGLMARNDLLKAALQQSNVELALLDAENNLKITTANMNLMLGYPEENVLVADTMAFRVVKDTLSLVGWERVAFDNRPDVKALTFREKSAMAGIKATKGEYYPALALTGGTVGAYIPDFITLSNAFNIGLGLQYNVGSIWKTGAKVDAAKARLDQVQASEGLLGDNVKLQINQAYFNYIVSIRKIDVYNQAMAQATENYRITKNKHENNLATTTDLLDADVAQLQAALNFAFSEADAFVTYNKLKQTAGIITE